MVELKKDCTNEDLHFLNYIIFSQKFCLANEIISISTKSGEIKEIIFNTTTNRYDFCLKYSCNQDQTLSSGILGEYCSFADHYSSSVLQNDNTNIRFLIEEVSQLVDVHIVLQSQEDEDNSNNNSIVWVDDSAVPTITNSEIVFEIMINKVIEYSFDGEIIKEWILNNKWIKNQEKINSNIYTFNQTLDGSLKMTISIVNYPYSSTLNNLHIQMESQVSTKNETKESEFNDENTEIKVQLMIMVLIWQNRNQCLIDPDFSVLLSTEFKSSCDEDNEKTGGRLFLILGYTRCCCSKSVFGVTAIVGTTFFIKKKKQDKTVIAKLIIIIVFL
ncbi:hypothetical protein ACTFIU_001060 [Dictyostelium citrinum]